MRDFVGLASEQWPVADLASTGSAQMSNEQSHFGPKPLQRVRQRLYPEVDLAKSSPLRVGRPEGGVLPPRSTGKDGAPFGGLPLCSDQVLRYVDMSYARLTVGRG